jgi:Zn-dependent alcohol dehydrogenase
VGAPRSRHHLRDRGAFRRVGVTTTAAPSVGEILNPRHDIPLLASMYLAGKLNLGDMVTREYRLDQINDGFRDMLRAILFAR